MSLFNLTVIKIVNIFNNSSKLYNILLFERQCTMYNIIVRYFYIYISYNLLIIKYRTNCRIILCFVVSFKMYALLKTTFYNNKLIFINI